MAYADEAATALAMLTEFGATVTLTRTVRGTVDLATNTATETTTTGTTAGVLLAPKAAGALAFAGGTLTVSRAQRLVLAGRTAADAALSLAPAPGVTATIGGQTFALGAVTPLAPDGGTPIVYLCDVEG